MTNHTSSEYTYCSKLKINEIKAGVRDLLLSFDLPEEVRGDDIKVVMKVGRRWESEWMGASPPRVRKQCLASQGK